jgi:hypothetical protein
MALENRMMLMGVLAIAVLLAGCTGSASSAGLSAFQLGWVNIAILAMLTMYFAVAILYMAGTGFGMPALVAWCKNEVFQLSATAVMLFLMILAITAIDGATRGVVGQEALAVYHVEPNDYALMKVGQGYMQCQYEFIWSTYNYVIVATAPLAIIYSSTIHIRPLKMGFSIQPAKFIQPIMDNVQIGTTLLGSGAWASKMVWMLLLFSDKVMFAIFLPLGVVLRSLPFTRQVGGVLIAMAVAFYVALPAAVLINAVVYEQHYGTMCRPTDLNSPAAGMGLNAPPPERVQAIFGGTWHYIKDAFVEGSGGTGNAVIGRVGGLASVLFAIFLGGGLPGAAAWLISGAIVGTIVAASLAWAREIIFIVVVLTFVGGVVQYMITFTFARELAKLLGSDVDLTSLLKLL